MNESGIDHGHTISSAYRVEHAIAARGTQRTSVNVITGDAKVVEAKLMTSYIGGHQQVRMQGECSRATKGLVFLVLIMSDR